MSKDNNRGLGRGLDSLFGDVKVEDVTKHRSVSDGDILLVEVSQIVANPGQPRQNFEENALDELERSVKKYGILQPLIVAKRQDGTYSLIAGERRLRAATKARIKQVPVLVQEADELRQLEISLIENIQRSDLNAYEQAVSIGKLKDDFNLTFERIADRLGKAYSTIVNSYRLLQLPENAIDYLIKGAISEGHARSILSLKEQPRRQQQLIQDIVERGISVRQAEQFAKQQKNLDEDTPEIKSAVHSYDDFEKRLGKSVGLPVKIKSTSKGGKVIITFSTQEELEKLSSIIKG